MPWVLHVYQASAELRHTFLSKIPGKEGPDAGPGRTLTHPGRSQLPWIDTNAISHVRVRTTRAEGYAFHTACQREP